MWVDAEVEEFCSECASTIHSGSRMVVNEDDDKFCEDCGVEIDGEDPEALLV